jgi:hypothetical protein
MTTGIELRVRIVGWDDPAFVRTFETARAQAREEGLTINGPKAAARAESLIRAAGYPTARIDCIRSVDEAMAHVAQWVVRREGTPD